MLAEVVVVGAVDDRIEPPRLGDLAQSRPQLGLAVVAAVGGIAEVTGIGQLARLHFEQRHLVPAGQLHRTPPLRLGIRWAPTDDREEALGAQHIRGNDGEQGGVDPARIAKQHSPTAEQMAPQEIEVGHGQ